MRGRSRLMTSSTTLNFIRDGQRKTHAETGDPFEQTDCWASDHCASRKQGNTG